MKASHSRNTRSNRETIDHNPSKSSDASSNKGAGTVGMPAIREKSTRGGTLATGKTNYSVTDDASKDANSSRNISNNRVNSSRTYNSNIKDVNSSKKVTKNS
jgi:hypothetical protein